MKKTTHRRKIQSAMTALEHLHAVLVFTSEFHSERRVGLRMAKERLPKLTNRELDEFLAQTEKDIQVRVEALKPRLPLSFYAEFLRDVPIALDQWLFLPKWRMKQWFGVMENALSALPEHSLLSFDLHGIDPPGTRGEVRILEASLFEDMCALFNRGWDLSPVAAARQSKPVIKECAACRRGAVLAAFYMIEAYLNSIAYDYLIANAREGPSDDMDKITEWDHKRDKQKVVSFRDKLLTYPRIILGVEHPPLQENNCPEMQFLLDDSKLFRDAIVHANPRTGNSPITERSKELYFWRIGSVTPVAFGKGTQLYSGEDTFVELARSSEGVVRDLINIFTKAYFHAHKRDRESIDRKAITEAARQWFEQDKAKNLDDDLQMVLRRIVDQVIGEKKARSFLLPRQLERHPIVQRLIDARVLHHVQRGFADKNNPGVRYNIYALDYGTYVDLMGTSKQPEIGFTEDHLDEEGFIVPFDDKRSIRQIVLTEDILRT